MDYIDRMEKELKELHDRAERLDKFLHNNIVPDYTERLMETQLNYMWLYEDVLKRRISYERRLHNE